MKRLYNKDFIRRARAVHGNKYSYINSRYIGMDRLVAITCPTHGDFKQYARNHLKGHECSKCSRVKTGVKRRLTNKVFLRRALKVHGDRYDYSLAKYTKAKNNVIIICKKHGRFEQTPDKHLSGAGCNECAGIVRSSNKGFITKANIVHNGAYQYNACDYINARTKVIITCPKHGHFIMTPNNHLRGKGCRKCNRSTGEVAVAKILDELGLVYHSEHVLQYTTYRYDFYIPSLGILIEYDGVQHYKPVNIFGGNDMLNKQRLVDASKTELAKLYGMILIRIPYTKYDNLKDYLIWSISRHYKYRVDKRYYSNFRELCKGENLPSNTTTVNVTKYLLYH